MCVHFCRALVPCPLLLTMALNLLARRHAHRSEGFFALHPGMQRRETALRSRAKVRDPALGNTNPLCEVAPVAHRVDDLHQVRDVDWLRGAGGGLLATLERLFALSKRPALGSKGALHLRPAAQQRAHDPNLDLRRNAPGEHGRVFVSPANLRAEPPELLLGGLEIGLVPGEIVLRGADLDSPVAKGADLVRPREGVLVETKHRKLGPGALRRLCERGDRGAGVGLGALGGSELRARVLGKQDHFAQRLERLVDLAFSVHVTVHAADAAQPIALPGPLSELGIEARNCFLGDLERALELVPTVRRERVFANRLLDLLQAVKRHVVRAVLRAAPVPESVGLRAERFQVLAKVLDSGARREQHPTHLVLRIEDLAAPASKPRVIETEHALEERPVGAGEIGSQHPVVSNEREPVRAEQRLLRALAAHDLEWPRVAVQERTDSKTLQLMVKPERGSARDPEQQIAERGEPGGLPRLVLTVEDVDVGLRRGQLDRSAGKAAVSDEVESLNSHDLAPCNAGSVRRSGTGRGRRGARRVELPLFDPKSAPVRSESRPAEARTVARADSPRRTGGPAGAGRVS